jgi:hypothetical protein
MTMLMQTSFPHLTPPTPYLEVFLLLLLLLRSLLLRLHIPPCCRDAS